MTAAEQNEQDAIRKLVERLAETYSPTHSVEQVGQAVDAHYHRFDGSKVRTFVPLLVEHGAREQLRPRPKQNIASGSDGGPQSRGDHLNEPVHRRLVG